jgi:hypothetical protein
MAFVDCWPECYKFFSYLGVVTERLHVHFNPWILISVCCIPLAARRAFPTSILYSHLFLYDILVHVCRRDFLSYFLFFPSWFKEWECHAF